MVAADYQFNHIDNYKTEASGKISIRNVCKAFESEEGNNIIALNDINLDIYAGDFVSLVGSSG
ncbi:MAG: hypothetical protein KGZ33_03410, partial [Alkaliphilus sp.]|nr:hypothetical protein [Alkaliphilus sp.]